jgi:hypothetical protein
VKEEYMSENGPQHARRTGPPVWLVALIVVAVAIVVALHLTGVVGA